MKKISTITAVLIVLCMVFTAMPVFAAGAEEPARGVNNSVVIDSDAAGGYEGDYVVIYNPATSSSTSYSTGTMTGLIETTVNGSVEPAKAASDLPYYKVDVDPQMEEAAKTAKIEKAPEDTRDSYNVGDTKSFRIYAIYSPTGQSSVSFECLYVGAHCYIWTPVSSSDNTYPLDEIDSSFAKMAADEFDSKFDLMQSSFGNHTNGSNGDGKLHMLYYNIDDEWEPGQGYVAGFFYPSDITNNGLPILNIDTYPGVYYQNSSGTVYKSMDDTYNTMVHEYQHLINYSNTNGMSSWLNECFSAAAEEICYPGSSIVSRVQSWEGYYYSSNNDWLNPPTEFQYQSSNSLHNGYSMYTWSNNLDNTSLLTLYSQVSFFAQYLFTRFGNTIYRQISNAYSSSETSAITSATGVNVADLVRDFRIAVYANAAESLGTNYGFKPQAGYDPSEYHNVQNPYDLLAPVVFTGSSCSIKGGGAICVKPVNGVYNPPSGASSSLKYFGITIQSYEVTAVSNNTSYGTVAVTGNTITATPAVGYYVESCEVISGTATYTINGNIIRVKPSSDCTIRVNFAPKPQYTVNYVACGVAEGSVTAYVNDVITLPNSVSVNPDGWTFIGWTTGQLAETTNKPTYYAPGASYTVTGNVTLYALYNRTEGGGEVVYQLTDHIEDGLNYIIVAQDTISGTSAKAVGNTVVTSNKYLSAVSVTLNNTDNTVTATAANLPNVVWEASGNATSGYSFYNAAVGKYMALNSAQVLYPATSGIIYWLYESDQSLNNQVDTDGYYWLSYSDGSDSVGYERYTTSTSSDNAINLYKETALGTTYYTTDPVASTPTYTVTFKDWDGTVLKTEEVEQGGAATAPADPTRVGYTFTGWDVAFDNVTSDLVVTAQYTVNSYTLTINYVYANGTTARNPYTGTFNYGASYSVASPSITGYTASQATVSGTMPANNVTVTVTYTANSYTLTINYVDQNGNSVAPAYTGTYAYGASYSVTSPTVEGYTTTQTVVSGTMGAQNATITVTYTQNVTPPAGLLGDVNNDGVVDFSDASALAAFLMGGNQPAGLANADANQDGSVTIADITAIYAIIFG